MKDLSVYGAAASHQQNQFQNEPVSPASDRMEDAAVSQALLPQAEDDSKNLIDMIREAQEKADAQRESLKIPNTTRYGDAPLEAYARLARARTSAEVNSASGYARRRLCQFKSALRTDSENSAKIKAAISQLQKAIARGERKKRELSKEQLAELRRKRAAQQNKKDLELRLRQELHRKKGQRIVREFGYAREADTANRLAAQVTATQMQLRQQAQNLAAATTISAATAAQQYAAASESAAAAPAEIAFQGEA